jgi:DNA-binding MarR family transcriptional regulator
MSASSARSRPRPAPRKAAPASDRFEASFALVEITRLMRAAFDERMKALGLTGATWRVLGRLARQDGQTQAMLARRLEVTPVALGETIDRLVKSGHVERRADPNDRRKWRIHLTEKAVALVPAMLETAHAVQAELFQDLDADEIEGLAASLAKLRARIHEMKIDAGEDES